MEKVKITTFNDDGSWSDEINYESIHNNYSIDQREKNILNEARLKANGLNFTIKTWLSGKLFYRFVINNVSNDTNKEQ